MQKVSPFTAALRTPKFQLYYLIDYLYYNSYTMLDVYRKKTMSLTAPSLSSKFLFSSWIL